MINKDKINPLSSHEISVLNTEHKIELLKERIYATIALLAIMLTIDTKEASPLEAGIIIGGTAVSLWIASIISTRMSRRIVLGHQNESREKTEYLFSKHTPLLTAAFFPLLMIIISFTGFIPLSQAILLGIAELFFFLIIMSYQSAKAFHISNFSTIIIAAIEIVLGFLIIWLKMYVSH